MSSNTATPVTALQAQAAANQFLSEHLPDRFTADLSQRSADGEVWQVPVILAYPLVGSLGEVGEVYIDAETEHVVWHTPFADMLQSARQLYDKNREKLEAAFS